MNDLPSQLEQTDELPVLSEEAVEKSPDAYVTELERLASELAAVRRALERNDERLRELEARLGAQNESIQRLVSQIEASAPRDRDSRGASRRIDRWRRRHPR